jgi:hypothetical protein
MLFVSGIVFYPGKTKWIGVEIRGIWGVQIRCSSRESLRSSREVHGNHLIIYPATAASNRRSYEGPYPRDERPPQTRIRKCRRKAITEVFEKNIDELMEFDTLLIEIRAPCIQTSSGTLSR